MGGCATTLYAGVRVGWAGMAWVRAVGTAGDGCRARRWEGAQRPYTRRRGSAEPGWPGPARSARLVMVAERGNRRVRNDPIRGYAGRPGRDGVGPRERRRRRWGPSTEWEGAQRPYTWLCRSGGPGWHGVARTVLLAVVAGRGTGGCATNLYAAIRDRRVGWSWAEGTVWPGVVTERGTRDLAQRPYTRVYGSAGPGVVLRLHRASGVGREPRIFDTVQQSCAIAAGQATTRPWRGGALAASAPASELSRSGRSARRDAGRLAAACAAADAAACQAPIVAGWRKVL